VDCAGAVALDAANLTTTEMLFDHDFEVSGAVRLSNAVVANDVNFDNASLTSLAGQQMSIGGSLLLRNGVCVAEAIDLTGLTAAGSIDVVEARFDPDSVLTLRHLRARSLVLTPRTPPKRVDLRHTRVEELVDDPRVWASEIQLRELAYNTVTGTNDDSVHSRIAWLQRDPDGYSPQPYEQLAVMYRRTGNDPAARTVSVAKHRHQRTTLDPASKLANWLLFITVGYGYRTSRSGLWLLAFLAVGAKVFHDAYPTHMIAKSQPGPPFSAIAFAVDTVVPLIDLGQRASWQPLGIALYWSWILTIAGWILTTAIVASITGLLKKD
jgi:hypothetical protein